MVSFSSLFISALLSTISSSEPLLKEDSVKPLLIPEKTTNLLRILGKLKTLKSKIF